jgi:hypothetical protein
MSGIPVDVAVEDELSESVVLRLLAVVKPIYHVGVTYRRGGFGYLRRTVNGWNAAAKGKPFVVLTDLDDASCRKSHRGMVDVGTKPKLALSRRRERSRGVVACRR